MVEVRARNSQTVQREVRAWFVATGGMVSKPCKEADFAKTKWALKPWSDFKQTINAILAKAHVFRALHFPGQILLLQGPENMPPVRGALRGLGAGRQK
jgi:hypothetical protein